MPFKYAWLISAEKINFVRTCCGRNKSDGLHNKGSHARGNIKWRSFALRFCASTLNAHDNLCFPLRRAYLLFYVLTFSFYFILESRWSSPFPFSFYPLASSSCLKDPDAYYCWHHRKVNTLGGNTISPYLSQCPVETP